MRKLHTSILLAWQRFAILFLFAGTILFYNANALAQNHSLTKTTPEAIGLDSKHVDRIDALVELEIEAQKLPGCVVMIGRKDAIGFAKAYGNKQIEPTPKAMTIDTVFDLASLTKPIATATSIMMLVERGEIRLRDPVSKHIPEFAQSGKRSITIEQLLTHQGGLIPDNPLADYQQGSEEAWNNIWKLEPKYEIGKKFVYTDVGFLVLGELVRRVSGQNLAEFSGANLFHPLGMKETGFLPSDELKKRCAPTEKREGNWIQGEVHDPRAYLLGGVAGHAGLFSTADNLALYANMMLSQGTAGGKRILGSETIKEMIRPRNISGQLRSLGWDNRSKYSSNRGELLSPRAFGHGGFTGTAMWIDPELNLFVIFLSNRVHPDGKGYVNDLAGRICTVAAAAITANP